MISIHQRNILFLLFDRDIENYIEYFLIKSNIPDWFQTTIYTRVQVNITKRMKNHPVCSELFSINIWLKNKQSNQLQPAAIRLRCGLIKKSTISTENVHHPFFSFLCFVPTHKNYSSLCRSLVFFLRIDTHPSKKG